MKPAQGFFRSGPIVSVTVRPMVRRPPRRNFRGSPARSNNSSALGTVCRVPRGSTVVSDRRDRDRLGFCSVDGLTLLVPPGCVVEIDGRAGDEPDVRTHPPRRRLIRSRTLSQFPNPAVPSSTLSARRLISASHRARASSGSSATPSSGCRVTRHEVRAACGLCRRPRVGGVDRRRRG